MTIHLNVGIVFLILGALFSLIFFYSIIRSGKLVFIQKLFAWITLLSFLWCSSTAAGNILVGLNIQEPLIFDVIILGCAGLLAPLVYLSSKVFGNHQFTLKKHHFLYFVIPLITIILSATNDFHHYVWINRSAKVSLLVFSWYFYIHMWFCYIFMGISIYNYLETSIRSTGWLSKETKLIMMGIVLPLLVNLVTVFKLIKIDIDMTPIMVSMTCAMLYLVSLQKNDIDLFPIAIETAVNNISEGIAVIDKNFKILALNSPLVNMFDSIIEITRNTNVMDMLHYLKLDESIFLSSYRTSWQNEVKCEPTIFEIGNKIFDVEFTPLRMSGNSMATVLLIRDITEQTNNMKVLKNLNDELQRAYKILEDRAEHDELTGAFNRGYFNHYYKKELERALSHYKYQMNDPTGMNFGIALVDIDNFKKVNDTYGHLAGDEVLKQVVSLIQNHVFKRDYVCRYGGEEIVIIFTRTPKVNAILAAEKIRETIDNNIFYFNDEYPEGHVTVSIGVAFFSDDYDSDVKHDILNIADQRLYIAKRTGKNKVISEGGVCIEQV